MSRFICKSELFEFELTIDINIDLYPLKVGAAGRWASSLHQHARQHRWLVVACKCSRTAGAALGDGMDSYSSNWHTSRPGSRQQLSATLSWCQTDKHST